MPTKKEFDVIYMQMAYNFSALSKAKRKKVGAVIVTTDGVCLPGYNGSVPGSDNDLEYVTDSGELVTKESTLHAELNCLLKSIGSGISVKGASLYVTLAPCEQCAAMIITVGICEVVYLEEYRCKKGLIFLQNHGIVVRKFKES